MAQLRQDFAKFTTRSAVIMVVTPDDQESVAAYWRQERLPFPGLPDPDHRVADLYEQQVSLLRLGRMPELAIIDRGGTIRYLHRASWMSDIPSNQTLFEVLDQLNQVAHA